MTAQGLTRDELPVVPLGTPDAWLDLHPHFARAREQSAIAVNEGGGLMLLRHAEIDSVLRDSVRFGAADLTAVFGGTNPIILEWWADLLASHNPPDHTRLRKLVTRAFSAKRSEESRPFVRSVAENLIGRAAAQGKTDVQAEIAADLPAAVMAHVLGVPDEDRDEFDQWATDLGRFFCFDASDPEVERRIVAAIEGLDGYIRRLVEARRGGDGHDLVADLCAAEIDGDRLTIGELIAMVGNLIFAGLDTTRNMIEIAILLLSDHPDQLARLRAEPALIPNAVEEALRFEGSNIMAARAPYADLTLLGVKVNAGEPVIAMTISGDRDPRRWNDADSFDVTRTGAKSQIFGAGLHVCLGASLARIELQEFLGALARKCESVSVIGRPQFMPFQALRRLDRVEAEFVAVRTPMS